jgi:conjugative transfer region lipoprotein (TIGR03751 family)
MQQTWTEHRTGVALAAATLTVVAALSGCATNTEDLLSHDSSSMRDIWDKSAGVGTDSGMANRRLLDARLSLRRPFQGEQAQGPTGLPPPVSGTVDLAAYTRTAQNEIQRQFLRLPNPDLVMYVFPHLAGTQAVPIPGYSTLFPLYQRVQYAMPGERVEDY